MGGLEMDPVKTSLSMTLIAISKLFFQTFGFRPLVAMIGARRSFQIGIFAVAPACIGLGLLNYVYRTMGAGLVWLILGSSLILFGFAEAISYLR
jgi:hypothetical protein